MKQVMEVDIIALEQIQQQSLLMQNHYQKYQQPIVLVV